MRTEYYPAAFIGRLAMSFSVKTTETQFFTFDSLQLEAGGRLAPVTLAYEAYGVLNAAKSNAILIFHALSGDAHAAGVNAEGEVGWWDDYIGPGKAFDTNEYYVICSNVIGGCRGSSGPGCINPATGRRYALTFPMVTIRDMVNAQKRLLDHLGISSEEVAAFGDGLNDYEMIESVGYGIAMGNAGDELKEKARFVTKPMKEDGIAYAVNEWIVK